MTAGFTSMADAGFTSMAVSGINTDVASSGTKGGGGCLNGGSGIRGGQSATENIVSKSVVWDFNSMQETTAQNT